MTVEESKESMGRACAPRDQFPVGMRVLAVDDDLTCLKLLEALLRRCQYNVTTTNQAIVALKLLRENKDGFDLVISDVHMPDMDGFKLLELVGLEMDLPVIMLSANGETSAVMKGITHGACDYLLKPVRIEELKNIWQHVVRRRKFENKDYSNFINGDDDEKPQANSNGGRDPFTNGSSGHSGKLNRKRKDQDEEEDDGSEENSNENEDPSAQKKPRVVWSIELHRKFVTAVNQLGIDKAVPKRILDLMNVDKLTRENVASHLQKYRLYLKRLNAVASQQANMAAALGGRDSSYLPTSSLDGYRSFNALVRSGQLPALHSFQPSGLLSRTSYPTGMGLHALPSHGTVQFTHTNSIISNPISDLSKFHHIISPVNHQGNLLQGLPAKLELDPLPQTRVQDANNCLPGGFSGDGLASRISRNSIANAASSSMMLQSNQQRTQARVLGNYSSSDVPSLSSDPFKVTVGSSLQLPDLARCNATWQDAGSITKNVVAAPLHHSVRGIDPKCQASPLGGNMMLVPMTVHIDEGSKSSNSRHTGNSKQKQEEHTTVDNNKPNLIYCSSTSPSRPNHPIGHLSENHGLHSGFCNIKAEINTIAQSNFGTSFFPQYCKLDKSTIDGQMKNEYNMEGSKLQAGLRSNGGSLDDLVNAMIKPERNDLTFVDGEAECDIFPLGICM